MYVYTYHGMASIHTYIYTYIHTYIYIYAQHVYMYIYVYVCICMYMYVYVHTHIYIHIERERKKNNQIYIYIPIYGHRYWEHDDKASNLEGNIFWEKPIPSKTERDIKKPLVYFFWGISYNGDRKDSGSLIIKTVHIIQKLWDPKKVDNWKGLRKSR